MAEARRGVVPLPALGLHEARPNFTSHRIQVALDQNGVVVFIPHIRFLFRNVLRTLWRTRNKIRDACFPLPAWFVISFSVGAASLTIQAGTQNDSTVCSKSSQNTPWRHLLRCIQIPFASIIVHSIKPLTHSVPEALQSGAIGFSLSALYLYVFSVSQRFIIRSLLTYDDWIFEVRKKMSVKTKLWAFLLKHIYVHPKRVLLLTFQNCLPTQPLPALDTTVQQYLESIEPLVNAQEFNTLRIQARRFVDEEGKTLQRYLKFKHVLSRNYVSEWWLNLVYLRSRSSLTINSNYYGMTAAYGVPTPHQVSRAAVVIHNLVRVKLQIDHETLLPQCIQGFMPICMDQHIHAFSSVREPHQEQDKLVQYDSLESRHVLVIHRGRMYTVSCFSDRSRRPLTCKQLETTLRGIVEDPTEPSPVEAAIPILTSLDRATWAQIRERFFQQDAVNESALEKIERALFVVCLDDCAPKNWLEEGRNLFIGDYGKNRWTDKSFNLVVTSNAKVGIEAEHSWGDAVTMSYLLEVAFIEEIRARPYERDGSVRRVARDIQKGDKTQYPARRVQFNVTDELAAVIRSAVPSVQKELSDLDLAVDVFTDYGKEVIKRAKCSPDGWIQMALQLAYYRDQHKFDQTYESSTLRRFYMGRTETIRSVSKASCAFVLAMEDPTVPRSEVARLLQVACEQHQTTSRLAFLGRGVDRHLFALYVVSVGMGIQSPFLKAFLSRKWSLSTSQTPLRQTMDGTWPLNDQGNRFPSPCGGFAPVTDDGYGVSYTVAGDYRLFFHVSAKHSAENTDAKRFFDRIMVALGEMRALFPEIPDVPLPAEFDMAYDAYICLDDCIPFDYK